VFAPEIVYSYPDIAPLIAMVDKVYGRSPEDLNQSFHKSWAKVRDASIAQLVIEQLIHYFTTYGFEALGMYDQDSVYIPNEQLDIPALTEGIKLVVIKGYTKRELKEKLLGLLSTGIALHADTIRDAFEVAGFVGMTDADIEAVKNKEMKTAL